MPHVVAVKYVYGPVFSACNQQVLARRSRRLIGQQQYASRALIDIPNIQIALIVRRKPVQNRKRSTAGLSQLHDGVAESGVPIVGAVSGDDVNIGI